VFYRFGQAASPLLVQVTIRSSAARITGFNDGRALRPGMTREDVQAAIGEPTFSRDDLRVHTFDLVARAEAAASLELNLALEYRGERLRTITASTALP
jgi:hypothetical protein